MPLESNAIAFGYSNLLSSGPNPSPPTNQDLVQIPELVWTAFIIRWLPFEKY